MTVLIVDTDKVAEVMVQHFNFDISVENMEHDRENYSWALLDALSKLYDLESMIDNSLIRRRE